MTVKNDNAPSAAQIAAYRSLWLRLLAPRIPGDVAENKAQKTKAAEGGDKRRPKTKTNDAA